MSSAPAARDILDQHRPVHSVVAGQVICLGCDWAAMTTGNSPDGYAEHRGHQGDLIDERTRPLHEELERLRPPACAMAHQPPMDFAYCSVHDTTFPLGQACKYDGRDMWEVAAEEADEQRALKVRAEMALEQAQTSVAAYRAAHPDIEGPWDGVLGRVSEPLSPEDLQAWSQHNLPNGTVRA